MRNYVIYCLIVCLVPSCTIHDISRKAVDNSFSSIIITQKAMTKILIESTNAIFQQDELKQDTSIYIHLLDANFIGKVDTFELEINSIKATWIDDTTMFFNKINIVNDSLKFDKVSIPYYNSYFGLDTIKVNVICKYLPNMNFIANENNLRCLTADYIIKEQTIILAEKFKKCTMSIK